MSSVFFDEPSTVYSTDGDSGVIAHRLIAKERQKHRARLTIIFGSIMAVFGIFLIANLLPKENLASMRNEGDAHITASNDVVLVPNFMTSVFTDLAIDKIEQNNNRGTESNKRNSEVEACCSGAVCCCVSYLCVAGCFDLCCPEHEDVEFNESRFFWVYRRSGFPGPKDADDTDSTSDDHVEEAMDEADKNFAENANIDESRNNLKLNIPGKFDVGKQNIKIDFSVLNKLQNDRFSKKSASKKALKNKALVLNSGPDASDSGSSSETSDSNSGRTSGESSDESNSSESTDSSESSASDSDDERNFERDARDQRSTFYHGANEGPNGSSFIVMERNEEYELGAKDASAYYPLTLKGLGFNPFEWPVDFNVLKGVDNFNSHTMTAQGIEGRVKEFFTPGAKGNGSEMDFDTEYRRVERAAAFAMAAYSSPNLQWAQLKSCYADEAGNVDMANREPDTDEFGNLVNKQWFPQAVDAAYAQFLTANYYALSAPRSNDRMAQGAAVDSQVELDFFEEGRFDKGTPYYRNQLSLTGASDFLLGNWNSKLITSEEEKLQALVSFSATANRGTQYLMNAALKAGTDVKAVTDAVEEAQSELTMDVVIAFRGTVDKVNWIKHNMKQTMVQSCPAHSHQKTLGKKSAKKSAKQDYVPEGAGFHEGYRCVAWPVLRKSVFAAIDEVMKPDNRGADGAEFAFWPEVKEKGETTTNAPLVRASVRKLRFHFTGHSMGAGIATIAGLDLHGVLSDNHAFGVHFPETVQALKEKADKEGKDEEELMDEYRRDQRLASIVTVACSGVMDKKAVELVKKEFDGVSEESQGWQRAVLKEEDRAQKRGDTVLNEDNWADRFVRLEHEKDAFVHLTPEMKRFLPGEKEKLPGKLVKLVGDVYDEDKGRGPTATHDPKYYIQGIQNNYEEERVRENRLYANEEL